MLWWAPYSVMAGGTNTMETIIEYAIVMANCWDAASGENTSTPRQGPWWILDSWRRSGFRELGDQEHAVDDLQVGLRAVREPYPAALVSGDDGVENLVAGHDLGL